MSCAFCYYGLVLMTTELFETDVESGGACAADCRPLQTTDYMDLLWTTLAEFPGNNLLYLSNKLMYKIVKCQFCDFKTTVVKQYSTFFFATKAKTKNYKIYDCLHGFPFVRADLTHVN